MIGMLRGGVSGSFRSQIGWVVVPMLLGLSAGCSETVGPEPNRLDRARALWETADLGGYQFEFRRICFCGPDFVRPLLIVVLGGVVDSATYADTGAPHPGPLTDLPTIDDLFDEVQAAVDQSAFSIMADYHDSWGYPVSVSIDFIEHAIDEEMAFTVSSLFPLDP